VRLVPAEMMDVVHDGAAQMSEHEPENGLQNFLSCRRHAGRVSQVGKGSRVFVNGAGGVPILRREGKKSQNPHPESRRVRHPKALGNLAAAARC
jgi:hypothetical protein